MQLRRIGHIPRETDTAFRDETYAATSGRIAVWRLFGIEGLARCCDYGPARSRLKAGRRNRSILGGPGITAQLEPLNFNCDQVLSFHISFFPLSGLLAHSSAL